MLSIKFCPHCSAYTAVFHCPKCRALTRCSEVADIWTDGDGKVDPDDFPLLECDECGYVSEVNEIVRDSTLSMDVRFSTT